MPEEIGSLYIDVTSSGEKVVKDLTDIQTRLEKIASGKHSINISTGTVSKDLSAIAGNLKTLKENTSIKITAPTADVLEKVTKLRDVVHTLKNKEFTYTFTAKNLPGLLSGLEKLKVTLGEVTNTTSPVNFETNAAGIKTQITELKKSVDSISRGPKQIDFNGNSIAQQMRRMGDETQRTDKAQRQYNSSIREGRSLWTTFKDSFAIYGTGYVAIMALNTAISFLKSSFVDFNNTLQQAQIGFETILGSADKAQQLLGVVKQFAIQTPFSMQGLLPDVQKLLSFGVVDKNLPIKQLTKEVIGAMQSIGDATYALGRGKEGIARVVLAFGQMHTATIANAQDLRQLKEVGIDAWKYLAEATGKSTREVKKLVTAGLIPADQAIKTILAGMERDFAGGMEKAASRSIMGSLEVLTDTIQAQLAQISAPVIDRITEIINKAATAVSSQGFQTAMAQASKVLQGGLLKALDDAANAFGMLFDVLTKNPQAVKDILTFLVLRFTALAILSGSSSKLMMLALGLNAISGSTGELGAVARIAAPAITALSVALMALQTINGIRAGGGVLAALLGGKGNIGKITGFAKTVSGAVGAGAVVDSAVVPGAVAGSAAVTASIAALPLLVAALGTAGVAWEKYQQKLAQVSAANADLVFTSKAAGKEIGELTKYAGADPKIVDAVKALADQYDRLHGSLAGLNQLSDKDIPALRKQINFDPHFDDIDKQVLNDTLNKYQAVIDAEKRQLVFKTTLEVDANPLSFRNIKEAFGDTYGWIGQHFFGPLYQLWKDVLFNYPKAAITNLWNFWKSAFTHIEQFTASTASHISTYLRNAFVNATGGADGWGSHVLSIIGRVKDALTGTRQQIQNSVGAGARHVVQWYMGKTPDNGASLPGIPQAILDAGKPSPSVTANQRAAARAATSNVLPKITLGSGKDVAGTKAVTDASAALKRQLDDTAKSYDDMAKSAEDSAKRQVDALQGIADSLRGVFDSLQKSLVDKGIITNPLGGLIAQFQKSMNLQGQVDAIGAKYSAVIGAYSSKASTLRAQANNAGTAGASLIDAMAKSINTPMGAMACARFVSSWFNKLDIAVKTTDSAKGLVQNALKAGARRIPVSQAGAGDLLFMHSKSAPSGYHVGIGAGNGMFAAKNKDRFDKINGYGWQGALDTSALEAGKSVQGFTKTVNGSNTAVSSFSQTIGAFKGRLSSFFALSKGWGGSVPNDDTHQARFAFQRTLSTQQGQADLQNFAKQNHLTTQQASWEMRKRANQADVLINAAEAPGKAAAALKEAKKATDDYVKSQQDAIDIQDVLSSAVARYGQNQDAVNSIVDYAKTKQEILNNVNAMKIPAEQKDALAVEMLTAATKRQNAELANDAISKRTAYLQQMTEAINAAAAATAKSVRDQMRQIRDTGATPLQLAQNQIRDNQNDNPNQGSNLNTWLANAAKLTLAAKQTSLDAITAQVDKLKQAIGGSDGSASTAQMQAWKNQLAGIVAQLSDFAKQNPMFAGAIKVLSDSFDDLRESLSKLKDPFAELMNGLGKERQLNGLTGVNRQVAEFQQQLIDSKKYTPSQIDVATSQKRTNLTDMNLAAYQKDLGARATRIYAMTEWEATAADIKANFREQGFSEADISKFIGQEKWLSVFSQLKGIFNNAFNEIYTQGFQGFFNSIAAGVSDMLNKLASQVLSSYVMKMLTGLIPGLGGGAGGVAGLLGNVIGIGSGGGGLAGGFTMTSGLIPGFATGLPNVPVDNFVARLHKGEAVLTASEAQAWRNMSSSARAAGQSTMTANGGTVVNNYYNIGTMQANNPQQFIRKVAGTKTSRSEVKRQAFQFVSQGRGVQ